MATFLFGGSNTLQKNGWVKRLKAKISDDIINQSVGASTTLAAMFRFFSDNTPSAGDTVVWEYALNEVNHAKRGYELDTLLENLERFIVMCRDRSCKFTALVFTPKSEEFAKSRHIYYEKISGLFAHYRITHFDVSLEYRSVLGVDRLPANLFADNAHYADADELYEFIAVRCLENIKAADLPLQVKPVYAPAGRVTLLDDFCREEFQNSRMRFPAQSLPVEFKAGLSGRLICVVAICPAQEESGVRFRVLKGETDDLQFRFSTTRKKDINRPLLKTICFDNVKNFDWIVSEGDTIKMSRASGSGMYYAEPFMVKNIQNPADNPGVMIAGVLVETPE